MTRSVDSLLVEWRELVSWDGAEAHKYRRGFELGSELADALERLNARQEGLLEASRLAAEIAEENLRLREERDLFANALEIQISRHGQMRRVVEAARNGPCRHAHDHRTCDLCDALAALDAEETT